MERESVPDEARILVQSPLELKLLLALISEVNGCLLDCGVTSIVDLSGASPRTLVAGRSGFYAGMAPMEIGLQARVGKYRADFLLTLRRSDPATVLAVEVDGHEYHERTKEQASRDKARDRYFAKMGIAVFRYSGRDIFLDAGRCAQECILQLVKPPR